MILKQPKISITIWIKRRRKQLEWKNKVKKKGVSSCPLYHHQFGTEWTISVGQMAKGTLTSKISKKDFVEKLNKQVDTQPRGFSHVGDFFKINK